MPVTLADMISCRRLRWLGHVARMTFQTIVVWMVAPTPTTTWGKALLA